LTTLAYLANEIIANAQGIKDFGLSEFNAGVEFINSPGEIERDFKQTDLAFRGIQVLLATAYSQIAIADGPRVINRFGRYCLLYNEIGNQSGTGSMPRFIAQFPDLRCGLQIEEFMLAGMVVFALALMGQGKVETAALPDFKVGSVLITRDLVARFLKTVSVDPDTFKGRMLRVVSEKWHMHTLTNPLLRHPVIDIDGTHFTPVPQLLMDRCGEGIYQDFEEALNPSQFQRFCKDLGRTFEKYVGYLLEKTNSAWRVWIDLPYDGIRTCDFLILDGHDLILAECKSSHMVKLTKTFVNKSNYHRELKEIARGVEAIVRTANHLKEGKLKIDGLDIHQIKRWAGVVVTMDEYLLRPSTAHVYFSNGGLSVRLDTSPIRNYFLQMCRKEIRRSTYVSWQDVQRFQEYIQVVSVDDFEQHLATTMSGRTRLFDIASGRTLQSIHPELEKQFNRYWHSVSPMNG
jgi:hypothetical protein